MNNLIKNLSTYDVFNFSFPQAGSIKVWSRNLLFFKYTILSSFLWIVFEPSLYLIAIGYGLGHLVNDVNGAPYINFFAPAMLATTSMFIAYFETTYSTFSKLTKQKIFNSILLTPINATEIAWGEILWATSKSMFSVLGVYAVVLSLGLVSLKTLILVLPILILNSLLFASFGLLMSTYAKNYEWFIYSQSGLIIPMSLFCGTYFPLLVLPDIAFSFAQILPLTHTISAIRAIQSGVITPLIIVNILVLILFFIIITNVAISRFVKKLIE